MVLSPSSKAGLAALLLLIATPAIGMEEQEPLSSEIKKVTGDWVAEEWDDGEIKFHPDDFTWQSDIHLTVRAAEPALGRSAMDVARAHFDGFELDDDTLEPTVVNMADAKDMGEGILMKSYGWAYAFDSNFSQFGVVQRKDGSFIPFHGNCLVDDERYSEDQCLRAMMTILFALRGVDNLNVAMPDPPAPISVPYWSATYNSSGTTILSNRNFHGTVTATVMVSPPVEIPEAMLNARIEAYTDNLVDDFDEQIDKDPGTRQWVGSKDDPWFRRDFPEAFSGPSTIMAGTEKTPDGKVVLIGVRCPNPGWQGSCARAVSMSRQQVASGQAEQRRTGIISQTWGGFPTGGLKNADVEMVYLKGEGSSATGFYTLDFDAIMLMRDGTACKCFDRALGQIVPSESKAEDPDSWGRWAQKDGVITVIWPPMEMEVLDPSEVTKMAGGDAQTRI